MNKFHKLILVLFACIITIHSHANTSNIEHYISIANQLISTDLEKSELYLDSCKPYINNIKDRTLISNYYITSAKKDLQKGDFTQSIYILEKTIKELKQDGESENLAMAQFLLANGYYYETNYTQAIDHATHAINYYESIVDSLMIIKCTNLIGNLFFSLDQFYLAREHYKKVEAYAIEKNNDTLLLSSKSNLAVIYLSDSIPDFQTAITYYKSAITIAKRINSNSLSSIYTNLGGVFIELKNYTKAEEYLNMALKENPIDNSYLLSKIYFSLGVIAQDKKDFSKARSFINKSISASKIIKDVQELKEAYEKLSEIEFTAGNYSKSIFYLKAANQYYDSLINQKQQETIAKLELQIIENYNKKHQGLKNTINKLENEKKQGLTFRKIGFILMVISILALFTLRYVYSKKQREIIKHLKAVNETLNHKNNLLDKTIKTRDKLMSTIVHDIKNPLGTILGFAELLIHNKEKSLLYGKQIHKSASNLFTLLENLVSWAKAQNHKIITKPTDLNVSELVQINYSIFSEMADIKNIRLDNKCDNSHKIFADKQTINTAIRNIINNAIKFTPANGLIVITSELKDNQIYLHFQDSGIGIREQDIPLLFDADSDKDSIGNENQQGKGTGIGLVLTKEFIKLNHGIIKVTSEENKGTCFTICLPSKRIA